MKTFAHYDSHGVVRALVASDGPQHLTAVLIPEAGHFVAPIEDLKLDLGEPNLAKFREVAKGLKIEPARIVHQKQS